MKEARISFFVAIFCSVLLTQGEASLILVFMFGFAYAFTETVHFFWKLGRRKKSVPWHDKHFFTEKHQKIKTKRGQNVYHKGKTDYVIGLHACDKCDKTNTVAKFKRVTHERLGLICRSCGYNTFSTTNAK